jgi:hypothetical protein
VRKQNSVLFAAICAICTVAVASFAVSRYFDSAEKSVLIEYLPAFKEEDPTKVGPSSQAEAKLDKDELAILSKALDHCSVERQMTINGVIKDATVSYFGVTGDFHSTGESGQIEYLHSFKEEDRLKAKELWDKCIQPILDKLGNRTVLASSWSKTPPAQQLNPNELAKCLFAESKASGFSRPGVFGQVDSVSNACDSKICVVFTKETAEAIEKHRDPGITWISAIPGKEFSFALLKPYDTTKIDYGNDKLFYSLTTVDCPN